jgi:hypothetical protein
MIKQPHPPQQSWGVYWISLSVCPSFHSCSVSRHFYGLIFQILRWNLVWLFTIMSYRSSLSFIVIDQYLTELWTLGLRIFMKICFLDIFWINFSDIEMKLVMIVYNNELQIKFEFCHYWSIFDRVMGPWTWSYLRGQVAVEGILVPFRSRHLYGLAEI